MLRQPQWVRLLVILGAFFASLFLIDWASSFVAPCNAQHGEYQHNIGGAQHYECSNRDGAVTAGLYFSLDLIERLKPEVWTALATVIVGIFTGTLWWAVAGQYDDTRIIQRAFIAVEPGGIREFDSKDGRIACNIIIINAGNLPARNVRWTIYKGYSRNGAREKFPIREFTMVKNGIVLAPKAAAIKGGRPTNKKRFDAIRIGAEADKAWLYVWGKVAYHDGFRKGKFIEFCHRYNLNGAVGYAVRKKNGRHHEYGNRTDEG